MAHLECLFLKQVTLPKSGQRSTVKSQQGLEDRNVFRMAHLECLFVKQVTIPKSGQR